MPPLLPANEAGQRTPLLGRHSRELIPQRRRNPNNDLLFA
jgi:hypothetical protein